MTSLRSSGSSRAPSAVDATKSTNMTVSWRRSACGGGAAAIGCLPGLDPYAAPQSLQKRLSAGFSLPQALHCQGSGEPQSPQYLLWSATLAPQRGQIMRPSSTGSPENPSRRARQVVVTKSRDHKAARQHMSRARRVRGARGCPRNDHGLSFHRRSAAAARAKPYTGLIYDPFTCILMVVLILEFPAGGQIAMSTTVRRMVRDLDVMKRKLNTVAKRLNIKKKKTKAKRRGKK